MHNARTVAAIILACCGWGVVFAQDAPVPADDEHATPPDNADPAPPSVQTEDTPLRLQPIVVTATRTEKSLFEVPFFATIVTEEDLAEAMYRTVPEVLRDVPGVMVQKTGHGQGSPYIRGFTGYRTLMLIDGIRLNNSVFRDGPNQYWNTVDPYSIAAMEVIKGPSSVLYGSDAIGGTVSVFTKGPRMTDEPFTFGGRGYLRFSTGERSLSVRSELTSSWADRLGVYGGFSYKNFGDLQTGDGRQPFSGYDEYDGDFKAEYRFDPDTRLVVAYQQVRIDDAWRTHSTIHARPFAGTTVGTDQQRSLDQGRRLAYAQLHADNVPSFFQRARVSVSYQAMDECRDRIRSDGRRDIQGFDVGTIGAWVQLNSESPVGLWTYGAEFYRDDVDSNRTDYNADGSLNAIRIQGPVADDATYTTTAVYVQDDIPIGDLGDVILGARYTYVDADARTVQDPDTGDQTSISDNFDSLVGSARLLVHLDKSEHWNVFGGVSQAFRAPNLSDLTRFDTARSNEIETPSPGLDPEQYVSWEIGLKTEYENFQSSVSYYYTDIEDLIIRQPTGQVIDGDFEVTKRNGGSGYVQGVDFAASWRFHPCFTTFGSFSWQDGRADTYPTSAPVLVPEPLDRLAPMRGQIGLRWDAPERNVWVEGLVTVAAAQDRLSTRDESDTQRIPPGGTPGYTVLTLRSGWHVTDHFTVTAVLDNATNENYRIHGSGVNEPGLNFVLGLELRF